MTKRRIIVTGCGRSGTQFMAKLLSTLGLRCRHERIFTPDLPAELRSVHDLVEERWTDYDAEVSWTAVPFLPDAENDPVVIHLVRDPLKVLRCWNTHQLLSGDSDAGKFARRWLPECGQGDDFDRNIAYCVGWNKLLVKYSSHLTVFRFRVEDLVNSDFYRCLQLAGWDFSREVVEEAVNSIPKDIGRCPDMHVPELTWGKVFARGFQGGQLAELASFYGYPTGVDA